MINAFSTLSFSMEMDWVLLWLTAKVVGHRTTYLRLTGAAGIGVLPTLWVLLQQNLYAVPWELGLVWPLFMLGVALHGLPKRFWWKSYLLFVAMSLLAGGLFSAGMSWLRLWSPNFPYWGETLLVPALLIVLGVKMPKRRVRQLIGRESYGEITLELENRALTVPLLWDSGNELTDPVLHRPVVIVEMARVFEWLPEEVLAWMMKILQQDLDVPVPPAWQGRLGVVSFRTLTGKGVLPVVSLDRALGSYAGVWHAMVPVMVGISSQPVCPDASYQALATPKSLIQYPHERVGA